MDYQSLMTSAVADPLCATYNGSERLILVTDASGGRAWITPWEYLQANLTALSCPLLPHISRTQHDTL